jgi:hypothetical protein
MQKTNTRRGIRCDCFFSFLSINEMKRSSRGRPRKKKEISGYDGQHKNIIIHKIQPTIVKFHTCLVFSGNIP